MKRVYLDNAATSWPKPDSVYNAVLSAMRDLGAPAGRGSYREATEVERVIAQTRQLMAELVGADHGRRIIFTANATDSLNLAIHGMIRPGDHVVTTVVEHNSVLRPIRQLQSDAQVEATYVSCDERGMIDPQEVKSALRPNTRMIIVSHASNVTGAVQPCAEIGQIARERGVLFLIDAAQTVGHWPVDVADLGCSMLAAAGHKGLLGPLGVGVLYVAEGVEAQLRSVRQGGTGTESESDVQPAGLPQKYETGNLNVPGIFGLRAGLQYVVERGVDSLRQHQHELTGQLLDKLAPIDSVAVFGPADPAKQVGVVSMAITGYDPQEASSLLEGAYRIQTRSGLHCAARMHEALGTLGDGGTLRVSFGPFSVEDEVDSLVQALSELAQS